MDCGHAELFCALDVGLEVVYVEALLGGCVDVGGGGFVGYWVGLHDADFIAECRVADFSDPGPCGFDIVPMERVGVGEQADLIVIG